jgi:hypothetical protein
MKTHTKQKACVTQVGSGWLVRVASQQREVLGEALLYWYNPSFVTTTLNTNMAFVTLQKNRPCYMYI